MSVRMRPVVPAHICCQDGRIVIFNAKGDGYHRMVNWSMDVPWVPMPPAMEPVPATERRTSDGFESRRNKAPSRRRRKRASP